MSVSSAQARALEAIKRGDVRMVACGYAGSNSEAVHASEAIVVAGWAEPERWASSSPLVLTAEGEAVLAAARKEGR